jgi:hypothetical protein
MVLNGLLYIKKKQKQNPSNTCDIMEFVEQVPTGLKHILQIGSKRLIYRHKIKKENFLSVGPQ